MPNTVKKTEHDAALARHRERLYWLTLITGMANVLLIFFHLIDGHNVLSGVLLGGVVGALLIASIRANTDSYYQSLTTVGLRWMAFAIGVFALVALPTSARDNSLIDIFAPSLASYTSDGALITLIICLTFHLGYAFAFLRDRISISKGDHE